MNADQRSAASQSLVLLVAAELAVDESRLHRDLLLFDDLGVDSMTLVELLASLEDTFEITLPSSQECALRTLGDLLDLVLERIR